MRDRELRLLWVLCGLLLIAALWSLALCTQARRALFTAADDLQTCHELAENIRQLRDQPTVVRSTEMELPELTSQLSACLSGAGIAQDHLSRISPQPAARIGDTPFKERPTEIVLRKVAIKQLAQFLAGAAEQSRTLYFKQLRLSAANDGSAADDQWNVEITMGYRIYAPKSNQDHAQ